MNEVTLSKRRERSLLMALTLSTLTSISLFVIGAVSARTLRYWYLVWNVILAWLPLLFALAYGATLKKRHWWNWQTVGLGLLWLAFLPNSFYLVSDLIHIHSADQPNILYNVALFSSFAFNGLCLGFGSLFLMHHFWLRRMKARTTYFLAAATLFLSSFAIYLGRDLRWNSWDVVVNPIGILLNVSDRIVNPAANPQTFIVTGTFFVLLGSMYVVLWQFARIIRSR